MYCIVNYGSNKQYLAFQDMGEDFPYGYYLTDKDAFMAKLYNNKQNPTLFRTAKKAKDFIKFLSVMNHYFSDSNLNYEKIDNSYIPKCDMNCWKCNKKNKYRCKNLRNPYQNYCVHIMAKFEDGYKPDAEGTDYHCRKCLNKKCIYNKNF